MGPSADKLHNARSIVADQRQAGDAAFSPFKGGKDGTLWRYRTAVEFPWTAGGGPLVDESDRTGQEMERLAGV